VDFSCAISELSIISKGRLYVMLLCRPTASYGRHGTTSVNQSGGLLSSTRRSYLHVLEASYAASR